MNFQTAGKNSEGLKSYLLEVILFHCFLPSLAYDFADYAGSGFSRSKAPAIFGGAKQEAPTNDETKQILVTALFVSAAFALTDYFIGEAKEKKARKEAVKKSEAD